MAVNEKSLGFSVLDDASRGCWDAGFLSVVVKICNFTILNFPFIDAAGKCLAALRRLQGKKKNLEDAIFDLPMDMQIRCWLVGCSLFLPVLLPIFIIAAFMFGSRRGSRGRRPHSRPSETIRARCGSRKKK